DDAGVVLLHHLPEHRLHGVEDVGDVGRVLEGGPGLGVGPSADDGVGVTVVVLEALQDGPVTPRERAHGPDGVLGRDRAVVEPTLGAHPLETHRPRAVRRTRPMSSRWWWPSWATLCTIASDESSSSPMTTT